MPTSSNGRDSAGSSVVRRRPLASGSKVTPWISVDVSTTKKTMSKKVPAWGTSSMTGNVARTIGTAPRSPAQPSRADSRSEKRAQMVAASEASGRATNISTPATSRASPATSPKRLGNTSRPRVKKTAIWLTQARPSWKSATVRRAGRLALPSTRPAT